MMEVQIIEVNKELDFYKNQLITQYAHLFDNNINIPIKDYKVHVSLDHDAVPIFIKYYRIPYSLEPKVKESLDKLTGNH